MESSGTVGDIGAIGVFFHVRIVTSVGVLDGKQVSCMSLGIGSIGRGKGGVPE